MMDYARAYRALLEKDRAHERALHPPLPEGAQALWDAHWVREHGLSFLAFQELLWRVRDAATAQDVVHAAGTLHLGLSLLEVLEEEGVVQLGPDGALAWTRPLFPALPARLPALAQAPPPWLRALEVRPELGQLVASPQSSQRRVEWMLRDLPPFGRQALFLGDDDLTSVYLANVLAGSVRVIDVDPRILETLTRAKDAGLPIEAEPFDVRERLPERLRGLFDLVHLDPVDDGVWLEQWLRRAVEAAVPSEGARIFLNVSVRRLGLRFGAVYRFLAAHGFLLDARVPDCSAYAVAGSQDPFYRTHLPRLAARPTLGGLDWVVHTDLLVFRRQPGEWPLLFPQAYREIRRGI